MRYMSAAENSRLEQRLTGLSPTFTTAQARQVLLSSRDLASLVAKGEIDELARGSTDGQTHRRPRTQICRLCAHGLLALSCVTSPPWPCTS
jgi:hypothetical protein